MLSFCPNRWAVAGFLLASLGPLTSGGVSAQSSDSKARSASRAQSGALDELRWLEATPLDTKEEARVFAPVRPGEPPSLGSGRWMLCAGGDEVAVECRAWHAGGDAAPLPVAAPGVQITGTVLVGGRPVPGARVAVVPLGVASRRAFTLPLIWDPEHEALVRSVVTGDDGGFLIPPLTSGDYQLEIQPPGGGILLAEPFSLPSPEELLPRGQDPSVTRAVWDLGELAFDAGMRVEVRVTDAAGAPVRGAKVGGSQGDSLDTLVFFETEVDEEGVAVLSGLDPTAPARIVCVAEGYVRMVGRFEVPPPATHCAMEALAAAEGRVLDENEEPLAHAVVSLLGNEGADTEEVAPDDTGRYRLHGLVAGRYELEASAPGFRVASLGFQVEPGDTASLDTLTLYPGEAIAGQVFEGTTGEPIAGAAVEAVQLSRSDRTVTDSEGYFELLADPDRSLAVEVDMPGYPVHREEIPKAAFETGEPVRIEVWPGGRIQVVAWNEDGEGPCTGCELLISGPQGRLPKLVTDATGRALSKPLAPGRYAVQSVQTRSTGSVVRVSSGHEVRWTEVEAGDTVTVELGEPARWLRVLLEPAPPVSWRLTARGPGWQRHAQAQGAGVFQVQRAPGERVALTLRGPAGESLQAGAIPASFDGELFEVSLPAGRVHGRLILNEEPAARVEIVLLDATQATRRATVTTGEDGGFAVPFLPTGTYHLTVGGTVLQTFALSGNADLAMGEIPVGDLGPGSIPTP